MPVDQMTQFAALVQVTRESLVKAAPAAALADSRAVLSDYGRTKTLTPGLLPTLAAVAGNIGVQVKTHGTLRQVPAALVGDVRNDLYLASEVIRFIGKNEALPLDADTRAHLKAFKQQVDGATKFIPPWVKVVVAIALGLVTMVGWKRFVVTVGEKIGKTHLTYAQGASPELVAMFTIGAADVFGLPVSTTDVLSSGAAGTMAANRSDLQWSTIRKLLMACVLTLPAAIALSGGLCWLFVQLF
jgi:PiT family inorganic phosphate transporter